MGPSLNLVTQFRSQKTKESSLVQNFPVYTKAGHMIHFTRATLASAGIDCRRVSVRLSQVGVLLKRLKAD